VGRSLYISYNEVEDLTTSLLSGVCSNVGIEPALQLKASYCNLPLLIEKVARDFCSRNAYAVYIFQ